MASHISYATFFLLMMAFAVNAYPENSKPTGNEFEARPVIYERIRTTGLGRLIGGACKLRHYLSDPEVSNRMYNLEEKISDLSSKGVECLARILLQAVNNQTYVIGRVVGFVITGGYNESMSTTSPAIETFPSLPFLLLTLPSFLAQVDLMTIRSEIADIYNHIQEECTGQILVDAMADLDFLRNRFFDILDQTENTKDYF